MATREGGSHGFGNSRLAATASIVLLVLGLLVAAFGVLLAAQGLATNAPDSPGLGGFFAGIGVVILTIGALQVIDAIFIWAHRAWARYLGIVFGVLGALFGANRLPGAFDSTYRTVNGGDPPGILTPPDISSILSGLILFPYVVALIGLLVGGPHFRRR